MSVPQAGEPDVKLKEDQPNEKSKDHLSWACYRKNVSPCHLCFGKTPWQAEEWESFRGNLFSDEKAALEFNISF